jgi:hypothetical protein
MVCVLVAPQPVGHAVGQLYTVAVPAGQQLSLVHGAVTVSNFRHACTAQVPVSYAQVLPGAALLMVVAGHERDVNVVMVEVIVLAHVEVGSKNSLVNSVVKVVVVLAGQRG